MSLANLPQTRRADLINRPVNRAALAQPAAITPPAAPAKRKRTTGKRGRPATGSAATVQVRISGGAYAKLLAAAKRERRSLIKQIDLLVSS